MTKLTDAAAKGDLYAVVKLIQDYGKQSNPAQVFAEPLSVAATAGHAEIVKVLISAGADINYMRSEGTPLHYAASGGGMPTHLSTIDPRHAQTVRILLDAGADVSLTDNPHNLEYKKWTALMTAIYHGQTEIAKMLIDAGADINYRDKEERTPLIVAAQCGVAAITELLLQAGAELEAKDINGKTAYAYVADADEAKSEEPSLGFGNFSGFDNLGQSKKSDTGLQDVFGELSSLFAPVDNIERSQRAEIARLLTAAGASTQLN